MAKQVRRQKLRSGGGGGGGVSIIEWAQQFSRAAYAFCCGRSSLVQACCIAGRRPFVILVDIVILVHSLGRLVFSLLSHHGPRRQSITSLQLW